jgi:hypothetical protein
VGDADSKNVDTWRTRQAVARYGPAARYALCRAALSLWQTNVECLRFITRIRASEDITKDAKANKAKAQGLVARLRKTRKSNEAEQVVAILHELDPSLRREERWLKQAKTKGFPVLLEFGAAAEKRFAFESVAALRHGDFDAFNALERVWKRWTSGQSHSNKRTLGLLELLQDRAKKVAWQKGGAAAAYPEAALGGDRVLSDAEWPELTAREVHSHLVKVKTFLRTQDEEGINEQLHEVRRLARRVGIKLRPDRRGRKPRSKNRN